MFVNQLSKNKKRYTYAENLDAYEALKRIAARERLDMADIVRRATRNFVENYRCHPRHNLSSSE